ncbi:MAG: hypothetical protein WAO55_16105 [Candidatus Manganitrophaceae bacterium]
MDSMRGRRIFIPLGLVLALLLSGALLTACGGGGGGGEEPSAGNNPAEGSTWDQMEWDKGKWG